MFSAVNGGPSETVRAVIAAYNERDMDAMLARFADDVVWHTTPGFLAEEPKGQEGGKVSRHNLCSLHAHS